jgi:hypothetical protein
MPTATTTSWKPGQVIRIRIPVYDVNPDPTVERDWHYNVWARLMVGETTQTYTTFTQMNVYTHNIKESITLIQHHADNSTAVLFAEIDFHIWEPDTYQLQIEIRYLYGSSKKPANTTGNWSGFTTTI